MKKIIVACLIVVLSLGIFVSHAEAASRVNGYYRSNGTYVNSYYRSDRNSTKADNYSSYGNYNPYTGKKGYLRY